MKLFIEFIYSIFNSLFYLFLLQYCPWILISQSWHPYVGHTEDAEETRSLPQRNNGDVVIFFLIMCVYFPSSIEAMQIFSFVVAFDHLILQELLIAKSNWKGRNNFLTSKAITNLHIKIFFLKFAPSLSYPAVEELHNSLKLPVDYSDSNIVNTVLL